MENGREIALEILLSAEKGEGFDSQLTGAVLDKYDYLEKREKALINRLAEGTIERQIELDYHLNRYSKVPVRKMKPLIRCLLRMSVYQILYMDSAPDYAVCSEAVTLAGRRGFSGLKGYVNGVLRAIARDKERLTYPGEGDDPVFAFSVRFSMPEWIVRMWIERYGKERTRRVLEALLEEHPVSLRINSLLDEEARQQLVNQMSEKGVELERSAYLPYVFEAKNTENIRRLPGYEEGLFTVQDVSSCLCVEAAGIQKKDVVLDLCAAPGGKTILAAEKAGKVYAFDLTEEKVARIAENIRRAGLSNTAVSVQDAAYFHPEWEEKADVLLMDVPCSGLGVAGKKRDVKYRIKPEEIKKLVELQKRIVEAGFRYVRRGGILLYSTCTIDPAENEEMAEWILKRFPVERADIRKNLPAAFLECLSMDDMLGENCVQILPGEIRADGFFFAGFIRKQEKG